MQEDLVSKAIDSYRQYEEARGQNNKDMACLAGKDYLAVAKEIEEE